MITSGKTETPVITGEAAEVVDEFGAVVGRSIFEIAQQKAQRRSASPDEPGVVELEDVLCAIRELRDTLDEQADRGSASAGKALVRRLAQEMSARLEAYAKAAGMADSNARSLKQSKEAIAALAQHKAKYDSNLKAIAAELAKQEHSDTITSRHVHLAHEALARLGLKIWPWWKRPELQVSIGGFLMGVAFALPDLVTFFLNRPSPKASLRASCLPHYPSADFLRFMGGFLDRLNKYPIYMRTFT